jgi:CubicO group peptidase (beta-lactamase class C family)
MSIRLLTLLLASSMFACTPGGGPILQPGSDLSVGAPTAKRTLKAHAADTFRIGLKEDGFVFGNANQLTVDVIVSILDPAGKVLTSFDSPARGPENFDFETDTAGVYKIVVEPFEENTGDYIFTLAGAEPIAKEPGVRIEQLVRASLGTLDGPGASIAVEKDGEIIYSGGFGHADLEHDAHNGSTTVFHIASVSKQFTAFSIAMLADQGKLSLQDDIRKYLPEMHDFGTPVTINHLIHHTSGLRDQWNLLMIAGWRLDDVITRKQIMRLISKQRELNFKPGDEYVYCNTGYTLMAEIVARVTGESFPDWTNKNIFAPLGMTNTLFYDDHERIVPNRAYSYHMGSDGFKKSVLSYANAGATSLFTTVEDLSKWADNFDHVKVGNDNVMKMMEERFVLNNGDTIDYAFGQAIGKYKGLKTVSHSGGDAGYRSFLLRFPEEHLAISVFSNFASFNPGGLSYRVADTYLRDKLKEEPEEEEGPRPAPSPPTPFNPADVALSDFTGTFYSPELETTYSLVVVNDTLRALHQRHDDRNLVPARKDEFSNNFLGTVAFTRGSGNKVTGMKISSGRVRNLAFLKVQ